MYLKTTPLTKKFGKIPGMLESTKSSDKAGKASRTRGERVNSKQSDTEAEPTLDPDFSRTVKDLGEVYDLISRLRKEMVDLKEEIRQVREVLEGKGEQGRNTSSNVVNTDEREKVDG